VEEMEFFTTLEDARTAGMQLGRYGQYPTIYKRGVKDYIIVERGEWPPEKSWPFLKWDGRDWVPIIVEFPGITFDLFFREAHIPSGAWIVSEVNPNYFIKHMKPPENIIDDEEQEIIEIEVSHP